MEMKDMAPEIVKRAFTRANKEVPGFEAEASPGLPLFDVPGAVLDSLNLISFVFILEEEFFKVSGKKLRITTEDVLKTVEPPFRNVEALTLFLSEKIHAP